MEADLESYLEEGRRELLSALADRVSDPRIVRAFAAVPRSVFVPETLAPYSYDDRALPIGEGQTISQPTMVAIMLEALAPRPTDRVLEVGGGSGYAAAVLSRLVREVHTIERIPTLVDGARAALTRAGIDNVHVYLGDGTKGLPELAPFDGVVVSAGAERVPVELEEQVAPGGRLVIPVGDRHGQVLRIGRRPASGGPLEWQQSTPCVFVPLIGS